MAVQGWLRDACMAVCQQQLNLRLCCDLFMMCFQMSCIEIIYLINNTNKQLSKCLVSAHRERHPVRKLEDFKQFCS